MEQPDGSIWISHDKGVSKCVVDIGVPLVVETLHMVPFRRFEVDVKKDAVEVIRDIFDKLRTDTSPALIQGDFNMNGDSLAEFLPKLFQNGLQEIKLSRPTTPKGRNYDRILSRGLKPIKTMVIDSALTDHYPVYAEFEI